MNLKLILGIFLPAILILLLVILSTANIGFSLEKKTVESIQFNSMFIDQNTTLTNIPVETITIINNFFLSKKYELPTLFACLHDKEAIKEIKTIQVKYNEGSYMSGSDIPIFDEIFFDYNYYSRSTINLPAESKKEVKILIQPTILYSYNSEIDSYKEYDEILLIESNKDNGYYYDYCRSLQSEDLNSAAHILISK